jgi:hypothetical protein
MMIRTLLAAAAHLALASTARAGSFDDCMRHEQHGHLTPADRRTFCKWAASPTDSEPDPEPVTRLVTFCAPIGGSVV